MRLKARVTKPKITKVLLSTYPADGEVYWFKMYTARSAAKVTTGQQNTSKTSIHCSRDVSRYVWGELGENEMNWGGRTSRQAECPWRTLLTYSIQAWKETAIDSSEVSAEGAFISACAVPHRRNWWQWWQTNNTPGQVMIRWWLLSRIRGFLQKRIFYRRLLINHFPLAFFFF